MWTELVNIALAHGYLGVFILALLCNMTFFLPAPVVVPIYALGVTHNPILLGLSSGIGSTIGEFSSYVIGVASKKVIDTRYEKQLRITRRLLEKHGMILIFIFALTPLPDDLLLVTFGVINYDLKKAFTAMLAGKILMNIGVAYAGRYSFPTLWMYITSISTLQIGILLFIGVLILYRASKIDWSSTLERFDVEDE
ncbi:MAG: VTT domain-containing protein [Candidatus Bathyarchaeota archaeon]|nr:VTT domain-containing protein [Candidatus Bathyarchaeota archaeon]